MNEILETVVVEALTVKKSAWQENKKKRNELKK